MLYLRPESFSYSSEGGPFRPVQNARTELATPFAREDELAEKTARLKELNILLNMDEKDKTLIDEAPDEGEEPPMRKVVGLER